MVRVLRSAVGCLLFVSIVIGTASDTAHESPRLSLGGYHVLAADFHIHSFPLSTLSPQLGEMGLCRTYVFAREQTEKGVLDALREGLTVVYDRENVYGDPAMIQLAAEDGRLPKLALSAREQNLGRLFSGIAGVLGLLALVTYGLVRR